VGSEAGLPRARRGRRLLATGLLALLLLPPLPARAESDPDVQGYLLSVNRLYEDLEYERALDQLARARRFARSVEDDVALSLYEGVILADMGRWEEASAAFKSALFLRPEAKLPVKVSPKVAQHFEGVRRAVQKERAASAAKQAQAPAPAQAPRPEAPRSDVPRAESPVAKAPPAAPVKEAEPPVAALEKEARSGGLRSRALLPAIGGGVLVVAGGVSWALSRQELSRLRDNDAGLATREDVHGSASRGSTLQTVGVGLLGTGVLSLGVAAGMYVFGAPEEGVALGMSTDGTSAFVQGVWP
jgi:tetratricopeptide (TPR) repeat protein